MRGKRFRLRKNKHGALEGLPLYLIILVVIAAVAIVTIMGWMRTIQKSDLGTIEINLKQGGKSVDTLKTGTMAYVTIYANDTNGKPLSGVAVKLEGAGQNIMKKTGSSGSVSFKFTPTLPKNVNNGEITVTATYTGNIPVTKTDTIIVNRA